MSKQVLVVDINNSKAIHCTFSHASKIIGVVPLTISRWAKKKVIKERNGYLCLFDYEEIKIKRGFNLDR